LTLIFDIVMRIRSLLFVAACIVATAANAQTATSPVIGCAPLDVSFAAPAGSTNSNSFWTFGDGSFAYTAIAANKYTVPGTYTVVFRAAPGGPPIGNPITVTVSPKPVPTITTTSALKGCVPLTVTLNGSATLPSNVTLTGVKWSYDDGSTAGTTTPTTHTYITPGKFTVTLEITTSSASCNVTKQFIDYISCSVPPATNFTTNPNPATACVPPLTVSFTNNTTSTLPLTYVWTMPNGSTFNGTTPAPVTITTVGNYMATLVAKDTNNCSSTYKVPISIGKPTASFTVSDTVCINTPVTFTNTSSSGAYLWNFGSGASPLTSAATNPVVTYNTPGLKTITLDVSSGTCSGTTTKTIYVDDPKITFTYTPVYSCFEPVKVVFNSTGTSKISTWNWSFGDKKNGTSTLEDPNYTYVVGDSIYTKRGMSVYTVTLNAVTAAGCKVSATHNDTIFLTWAKFVPNLYQGCAPLTVTFSDSSKSNTPREPITTWVWNYGDGKIDTVKNKGPQVHVFTNPGFYDVQLTITNKNGCKDTSYKVRIEVGAVKPIDFAVDKTSICPGDTISFTNTTIDKTGFTGWHYSTSGELLSHCANDDHPKQVFNNKTGPMDVTLTGDYNGCMSTITKPALITVKGPIAQFDFHRDCAKKFEVELTNKSGDATDLKWDFGDSTKLDTVGTMTKITHVYKKTGDYKVVLIAKNTTSGCVDSKDSAIIHIRNIKAQFTNAKLLCQGTDYPFDATASIDVNPHCYRGYTWEFSDPDKRPISTSDSKIPIAFYKNGVQNVSLIVEDINGCKDTAVTTIKAFKLKASYVASDLSICIPTTVTFDPAASTSDTTINTWNWFFGDGNTKVINTPGPGNTSNNYTVVAGSTVTATLVIMDKLGCTDTTRQVINIYKPTSKINVSPKANICLGTELTFSADDYTAQGSNLKFDWKMGDGIGVFNSTNNFKYTYAKSGSFLVTLNYTENGSGCTGVLTQTINVQDYPKVNFGSNPSNLTVLCYPQVVDFYDSTKAAQPLTYKWDLGNNLNSTSPNPSDSYQKGKYTVKLVVSTSFGCVDSISKIYNVVGPQGGFTLVPNTPLCRGELLTFTIKDTVDVASYTWKFGDGTSAVDKSPVVHSYSYVPPSGKTLGALILYDKNKVCSVSLPIDIFIKDVKANFDIKNMNSILDSTICDGQEVILKFTGKGDKAIWDLGDHTTSTDTLIHHTYTKPGDYYISLITSNASVGCSDTLVKTVTILPLPDITTMGDTICPNTPIATLHVRPNNGSMSYLWVGVNSPTSTDPTVSNPTKSQSYYVAGTDVNGCTSVDSAFLYIVPAISPISFEKTIIVGDTVVLPIDNKNGTIKFTWTPTEGLSCLQCSNPWVQPIKDITYNVVMQDFKGCSTAPGKFIIHVKPETRIRVPTTFTPNGDGNNDIIYVRGWGIKDLISFQIYNRWGELVFETSELSQGWNGFYKDVLQNNDIYTFKVKATDVYGEPMEANGHINLMR
jgi:gliding motility-associated-like protein